MSRKIKKQKSAVRKKIKTDVSLDFLAKADKYFTRNSKIFFWISIISAIFFGALLFNVKIDEGGDDSGYIMAAKDFIDGKQFPTWHGSLYPIFLGLPMLLFGVNVVTFKIISFFLIIGNLVLLFYTFKNRIPSTILVFTVVLTAINCHILFHASSTYSEAFFMLMQTLTVYFFFKLLEKSNENPNNIKKHWKTWLTFGLFMFLLSIARNVGIGFIIAVLLYFLVNKQYMQMVYSFVSFLIFQIPYTIYKNLFWKFSETGYEGQFGEMFWKDPYNRAIGKEDLSGFIERFFRNCDHYLSKNFLKIIGLKPLESTTMSKFSTILFCLLFIASVYFVFKKNKYLLFISIYLIVSIFATFISQQVLWDQPRLILIYVPLIVLLISVGIYELSKKYNLKYLQYFLVIFLSMLILLEFAQTKNKIKSNIPVLRENIKGDKFYGFSTDWKHYLQMSEWVSKNIPENPVIACRKPSMSFIYGKGRKFFGIAKFPVEEPTSVVRNLKKQNVVYTITDYSQWKEKDSILYEKFAPFLKVLINNKNTRGYGIYDFGTDTTLYSDLKKNNIDFSFDIDGFLDALSKSNAQVRAIIPDSLYNYLKKNNVKYLMDLSLTKINGDQKYTSITSIQQFILGITAKYPGSFKVVNQIGEYDDSPSRLYEFIPNP
ncbi:MAG: hypothetical protein PHD97_01265 [Bacteroidales bacterium]|nr:hypothetical protein [Bacteroidales bacterium]